MKIIFRTIKSTLLGMFSLKMVIFTLIIILIQFFYEINYIYLFKCDFGRSDVLIRMLMPISQNGFSPRELMQYLLPLLCAMMICGSYYQNEFNYRCRYTVPRSGNIYKWYNANMASLLIISIILTLSYFIINIVICKVLNIPKGLFIEMNQNMIYTYYNDNPVVTTLHFLFGFGFRVLLTLCMQMVLMLKFRNTQISIAIPLALLLGSILIKRMCLYFPFGATHVISVINENKKMANAYIILFTTYLIIYLLGLLETKNRKFLVKNTILR